MSDFPSTAHGHQAHIVVHPVVDASPPFRRVDVLGTQVGKAHSLDDVAEFARRAGLDDFDPHDPQTVDWHGGGPDSWQ